MLSFQDKIKPVSTTTASQPSFANKVRPVQKQAPTTPEVQQTDTSLLGKLGGRVSQFGTAMTQNAYPSQPVIGGLGAIAGGINDVIGAAVSPFIQKAVNTVSDSPTLQKIAMSKPVNSTLDVTNKGLGMVQTGYSAFKQAMPKTAQFTEDVANISSLLPFGKGVSVTKNVVSDTVRPLTESAGTNAMSNLAKNLNETFKQGTIGVKKISDYADERGIDLGHEIASRKITPIVENDRLKFSPDAFKTLDIEIASDSSLLDEVVRQYPNTRILAGDIKKGIAEQIAKDPTLKRQGAVVDVTKKAFEKIDDLIAQQGRDAFTLEDIQMFKKGMWEASKKFKITEAGKSDAFSELGKYFMKVVEREIPDVNVHNINAKLGRAQETYKMLNKLNSLQDGGMVLKGGKIGKYGTGVVGTGLGSLVGSAFGPLGAAVGGFVGYKATEILRNLSQKSSILGPLDRALIKYAKDVPADSSIVEAKAFIDAVKSGMKPSVTPSVQKALENAWDYARQHINDVTIPQEKGTLKIPSGKDIKATIPTKETSQIRPTPIPLTGDSTLGKLNIKDKGNIYYPPKEKLPVIEMGKATKKDSGLPVIQIQPSAKQVQTPKTKSAITKVSIPETVLPKPKTSSKGLGTVEIKKKTSSGIGNYLYHGTNEDVLESISKEGLKPGMRGQLSLSKTEEYSKSFAKSPDFYKVKKDGVVFRVDASFLNGKTTAKRVDGKVRPMSDQINEVLTKETIPPEYLEIYKNGKWQPLVQKKGLGALTPKTDLLTTEAKKYKSAEEFVKTQDVYTHQTNRKFDDFDVKYAHKDDPAIWFYKGRAEANSNFPITMERFPKKNINLIPEDTLDDFMGKSPDDMPFYDYLASQGFDGIDYGDVVQIFNTQKSLKTKSQLTNIWKKANGGDTIESSAAIKRTPDTDEVILRDIAKKNNVEYERLNTDIDTLLSKADTWKDYVDNEAEKVVQGLTDVKVAIAPIKSKQRILEKTLKEEGGKLGNIKDIARNTIVPSTPKARTEVLKRMDARKDVFRRKDQKPEDFMGYEGTIYNIKTPDGQIVETQVVSPEMTYGKNLPEFSKSVLGKDVFNEIQKRTGLKPGQGHELYEKVRKLNEADPNYLELLAQYTQESFDYYSKLR
jgi:hypothetical protein